MTGRRWHLVGDDAALVELPDADAVALVGAALRAAPPRGVVDVVPAARTVLVRGSARGRSRWGEEVRRVADGALRRGASGASPADLSGLSGGSGASGGSGPSDRPGPSGEAGAGPRLVEIPVVYDGEDLATVAALTGLSPEEVVARHAAGRYRVAFGGFVPGFAYLVGLDPVLHLPRLATPRTRVPPGAVAIAGEYAAVYPRATPGGWRLLGRTGAVLFDPGRADRPALLSPGDAVRFVPGRGAPAVALGSANLAPVPREPAPLEFVPSGAGGHPATEGAVGVEVLATGPLALVEDAGRPGLAAVGVPRSGAADPAALRAANRLVGNRADAAVLEVVLGGLVVRFSSTTAIALVGALAPAELDGAPVPYGRAVRVPAGSTVALGTPDAGLRTWLAVRGGIGVPAVLGSRSRDVLSGLGPGPLAPGDTLPVGDAFDGLPELPVLGPAAVADGAHDAGHEVGAIALPATAGPRAEWLTDDARARLSGQEWTVAPATNRVALRLDGPPLLRLRPDELPSEGLVLGAVQVPHDGRPVVFGPDHPVTGGYPVVAVLTAEGIARAAQCRPGDRVRIVVWDEDHPELRT